jgi:hypothetical protein
MIPFQLRQLTQLANSGLPHAITLPQTDQGMSSQQPSGQALSRQAQNSSLNRPPITPFPRPNFPVAQYPEYEMQYTLAVACTLGNERNGGCMIICKTRVQ